VLNLSGAPHGEQPPFLGVLRLCSTAPQGVINSVYFDNPGERKRFVVGLGLAEASQ
jgi:hypothetical protein